jgi:hypothetical protein
MRNLSPKFINSFLVVASVLLTILVFRTVQTSKEVEFKSIELYYERLAFEGERIEREVTRVVDLFSSSLNSVIESPNSLSIIPRLLKSICSQEGVESASFISETGVCLVSSDSLIVGKIFKKAPFFTKVLNGNRVVEFAGEKGETGVYIAVKVGNASVAVIKFSPDFFKSSHIVTLPEPEEGVSFRAGVSTIDGICYDLFSKELFLFKSLDSKIRDSLDRAYPFKGYAINDLNLPQNSWEQIIQKGYAKIKRDDKIVYFFGKPIFNDAVVLLNIIDEKSFEQQHLPFQAILFEATGFFITLLLIFFIALYFTRKEIF